MEIQPVVAGSASRAVLQARSLGLRLVIGADPTLLRECRYCTMIYVNVNSATAKIAAREDQFQISDLVVLLQDGQSAGVRTSHGASTRITCDSLMISFGSGNFALPHRDYAFSDCNNPVRASTRCCI